MCVCVCVCVCVCGLGGEESNVLGYDMVVVFYLAFCLDVA